MRILIADDYPSVRAGIRMLLSQRADWSVCAEAEDGIDAVEKMTDLRPDVILMDISMPRMDGIEATKIVRREAPECAVILVSQNDPLIMSMQTREVGAIGFVCKADLDTELIRMLDGLAMQLQAHHTPTTERTDEPGTINEDSRKADRE